MLDRGLRRGFDPALEREANAAGQRVAAEQLDRRDLRALATFTIDPASARDYDDAISAQDSGDGSTRVWVHIADVAAHVPEGSPLDREARRRSTSVYVPGAVEPMLPHALSSDACSLMPRAERPAVTVELELRGAEVVSAAFYRSLIRSDARLDYDRVDRIFAGAEQAEDPWREPLAAARAAAAALQAKRERSGALVVESEEPEFDFDEHGNVIDVRGSVQTESHRLIEHLMIAANEAVARLLAEHRTPCLYRVHERPDPERIARLVDQLASLDVPTPPLPASSSERQHMTSTQAAELAGRHLQARRPARPAHRARADRPGIARAALAQAGLLLARQPRPCGPAFERLLPLHLSHPPLSRHRLPPRAAVGGGRRRARAARRRAGRARRVDLRTRARRDGRSSATATRSRCAFALAATAARSSTESMSSRARSAG